MDIYFNINSRGVCVNECTCFCLCVSMCVCVCRPRDSGTLSQSLPGPPPGSRRGHLSRLTPHSLSARLIHTVVTKKTLRPRDTEVRHTDALGSEVRKSISSGDTDAAHALRVGAGRPGGWPPCGNAACPLCLQPEIETPPGGMNLRLQPQ